MRFKNIWFLIASLSFCVKNVQAQVKKNIYFYVDTVTISPESRIAEIKREGGQVFYNFFCKCLEPKQNISFLYLMRAEKEASASRPMHEYVSWRKLLDLVDNDISKFNMMYILYIIERLPNGRYRTNRTFSDYHPTIVH